MKIDAKKLISEIERYKQGAAIARFDNAGENADYFQGKVDLCDDLTHIIASLQQEQPSLPSNLDEAAEEYAKNRAKDPELCYEYLYYEIIEAIKFGAEWRDSQILKFSDNLDEAAIDAAQLDMQDRQIMEATNDERQRYSRIFRRGFKAGAKWLAGQGETIVTCIMRDDVGDLVPVISDLSKIGLKVGDKVVVQIRKK